MNGHFSVPHDQKVRAAATACIALALPRRVSSCVDLPALVLPFRFHFAASLRQAHGANPPRRSRDSRHPCPPKKTRGYDRGHRNNYQPREWRGLARVVWLWVSCGGLGSMGVPKGAGNLRGARDKNWTVVAACLRSFRRALTAVHPEPARGPTLVTSATQLEIGEPCEFSAKPLNSPKFLDVTLQRPPTNFGVSPPLSREGHRKLEGVFSLQGTQVTEKGFEPTWAGPCSTFFGLGSAALSALHIYLFHSYSTLSTTRASREIDRDEKRKISNFGSL